VVAVLKTAVIILAIVVIIGMLNGVVCSFISGSTDKLTPYIANATAAVKAGDMNAAAGQIRELKKEWDGKESIWEAFVDHSETERVETLLTRLEGMIEANTPDQMLPELQELDFFFTHLNDKQKFRLENIF
jgi:hypothetical protein